MYESLNPAHILKTLQRLQARIDARFPDAGLSRVCAELTQTADSVATHAAQLGAPNWPLRLLVVAIIVVGVGAQIWAARTLHLDGLTGADLLQSLEAAVNLLILFGSAVWFLLTLEERSKRRRALEGLHRLRALAHVVDMHQLTKDPTMTTAVNPTAASPERT